MKKNVMKKTVNDLVPGDLFRLPGKRKYNDLFKKRLLEEGSYKGPADHLGKYILILEGCRQLVLAPDREVEVWIF